MYLSLCFKVLSYSPSSFMEYGKQINTERYNIQNPSPWHRELICPYRHIIIGVVKSFMLFCLLQKLCLI